MKLVMQHPHPEACALACVAMIADSDLETVIKMAGTNARAGQDVCARVLKGFGLELLEVCFTHAVGETCMGGLMHRHKTLLCELSSCLDPGYAHAVVVHEGQCYDPNAGMNPSYSWDKYISHVRVFGRKEAP